LDDFKEDAVLIVSSPEPVLTHLADMAPDTPEAIRLRFIERRTYLRDTGDERSRVDGDPPTHVTFTENTLGEIIQLQITNQGELSLPQKYLDAGWSSYFASAGTPRLLTKLKATLSCDATRIEMIRIRSEQIDIERTPRSPSVSRRTQPRTEGLDV
jgi:hypothetical protein